MSPNATHRPAPSASLESSPSPARARSVTRLRPATPPAALPPLRAPRLLDQVRERIRMLHYSHRTEQATCSGAALSSASAACGIPQPWAKSRWRPFSPTSRPSAAVCRWCCRTMKCSTCSPACRVSTNLLARLLYGTGMRIMEALRLRVKDLDFSQHAIYVREGKAARIGL